MTYTAIIRALHPSEIIISKDKDGMLFTFIPEFKKAYYLSEIGDKRYACVLILGVKNKEHAIEVGKKQKLIN
jgi:hypothetical protein